MISILPMPGFPLSLPEGAAAHGRLDPLLGHVVTRIPRTRGLARAAIDRRGTAAPAGVIRSPKILIGRGRRLEGVEDMGDTGRLA